MAGPDSYREHTIGRRDILMAISLLVVSGTNIWDSFANFISITKYNSNNGLK